MSDKRGVTWLTDGECPKWSVPGWDREPTSDGDALDECRQSFDVVAARARASSSRPATASSSSGHKSA